MDEDAHDTASNGTLTCVGSENDGYGAVMPTLANGKLAYLEIPAVDVRQSADFYSRVFGWALRRRGDGALAFDDAVGEVSGVWVTGRPPAAEPGLLIYIMVDDVEKTIASLVQHGGELIQPVGGEAPEVTARFRDPAGNVFGIFEQ
jgi:predicted enzyme related to lactoylglutathione lyase